MENEKSNIVRIATILVVVLLGLSFSALTASAQADSAGTEFFLVYTDNYDDGPGSAIFITSAVDTSGLVEIPAIGFSQAFTVTANTITNVNIPQTAEVLGSDIISDKGIRVTANDEVTVYFLNPRTPVCTNDAYLGLPVDILNVEYIVLGYQESLSARGFSHTIGPSEFAVVAPYDDTEVTITSSITTGTRTAGVPYTITLQQFETYTLQSDGALEDLTGTIIESSHPVAVFAGVRCADIPPGYGCCDHVVEQMMPTATWGKEFDTFPFKARRNGYGDILRVLACVDGTVVTIDGAVAGTINRGEFLETMVTAPSELSTSEPALVAQYLTGEDYEGRIGDPFECLIPPTEQFMPGYTFLTPTGYAENYVNVIAPTASLGDQVLDGSPVDTTLFTAFGTKGLSCGTITLSEGSHTMSGSAPFGIYVYGYNQYVSYGYPGGLALEFIYPRGDMNPPICDIWQVDDVTYAGSGTDNRPSEDVNGNGILDPGEDLNGNGLIDEDTGIFRVELEPGSTNLLLTVDPFIPGDPVVTYTVTLVDTSQDGSGTVRVTDGAGNNCTSEISITVGIPPVADAGSDKTVEQTYYQGANVTLNGSGSYDPDNDPLAYNWTWAGDSDTGVSPTVSLPLGTTTITLVVYDGTDYSDPDTVNITVVDTTPPVITCPADVTVEQETRDGTVVPLTATATDICDADVDITSDAPAIFPLGTTTVTFTATDDAGNTASCTTMVTVQDTTPPDISVTVSPDTLWPPNHKMVDITATVTVSDICDAAPTVVLTSVTSNEPDNAKGNGDGNTVNDIQEAEIGTEDYEFQLRAERAGKGDGRVYTITYTVTDASGNSASASATVVVPHDMG